MAAGSAEVIAYLPSITEAMIRAALGGNLRALNRAGTVTGIIDTPLDDGGCDW